MLSQIIFVIISIVVIILAFILYGRVFSNIKLGQAYKIEGSKSKRWKQMLLVALGQQKMFSNWIAGIFHLFIYLAFLITVTELVEIFADGIFGFHRFFAPYLGVIYTIVISTIEFLSVFAFVATLIFLYRRNVKKVKRFWKPEMKGWPFRDANLILMLEIILIFSIFSMNGADLILQERLPDIYHHAGPFIITQFIGPWIFESMSTDLLLIFERGGWWIHILVVFGFLLYLPISKHLHLLLAFPNTFLATNKARGEMNDIPMITDEVKSMLGINEDANVTENISDDIPEFGAKDIFDLSWKNILDSYTCTECGRCTSACPANQTGKVLSPRTIVMAVRDRADEVGKKIRSGKKEFIATPGENIEKPCKGNFNDNRSLFDYISKEEMFACTSCNACVEVCPVMIDPLDIILQMRRYEVLTLAQGPQDWISMFTNLENGGSVWQMQESREEWTKS